MNSDPNRGQTGPLIACDPPGPLENFRLGLRVLGSELKWLVIKGLRRLELRQLHTQLEREYALRGRLADHGPDRDSGARLEVADKQIRFLKDEIAFLEEEKQRRREEYVRRRLRDWGLPRETDETPS